jgi:hypothetical protein
MKAIAAGAVAAALIAIIASLGFDFVGQSSTDRFAVDYSVRLDKRSN